MKEDDPEYLTLPSDHGSADHLDDCLQIEELIILQQDEPSVDDGDQ